MFGGGNVHRCHALVLLDIVHMITRPDFIMAQTVFKSISVSINL